jgi:butyrate kinase
MKILSINPGSTSTKISLYDDLKSIFVQTLRHSAEEIAKYDSIISQLDFRKNLIVAFLKENNVELSSLEAIVGRGGLLRPIPGGVYRVNEKMLQDLKTSNKGEHASNLGGILAFEIANQATKEGGKNVPSFIVDPVVVDELNEIARISGHPELPRISIFHALNQKAVARRYARENGLDYDKLNLIVVHLGGGISIGLHNNGKVIDVNNALNGDGPFSPERAGALPTAALVDLCFSGKFSKEEILKMLTGKGGFVAYLGTNDTYEIEIRALEKKDAEAKKYLDAMIYQISKEIGFVAPVVAGKVDAILLTGGIARSEYVCEEITKKVAFIAPVKLFPGEDEMGALTEAVYYALKGEMDILEY